MVSIMKTSMEVGTIEVNAVTNDGTEAMISASCLRLWAAVTAPLWHKPHPGLYYQSTSSANVGGGQPAALEGSEIISK